MALKIGKKEMDEAVRKHLDLLVDELNNVHHPKANVGYVAQVAEAVTAVSLYRSSKNLERLSYVLIALTLVLATLTGVLVWHSFS